jgi:heme/copper-type cytochrome/quinol oxidase subunit 2
MGIRKMATIAALGLSMASAPVLAQSAPAARSGAEMVQASGQDEADGAWGASTTTYVIAFFVIIVIAIGIYFAIDDDGDGKTSP